MKVRHALDILKELNEEDEVYCLIYLREDAEVRTEDEPALTDTEWSAVVDGMEVNDDIDGTAYQQFGELVDTQLEKREQVNANK
jgi:hypothetical protein